MGKPRMIILIRHAQSEGNKNRDIHQFIPDHRVKLTADGWQQAEEAGRRLRSLLNPDDTLQFFTSPYRRTRETTEGILRSLTSDTPSPSPFPRHSIKVFEEPRLREQDFGNFQPCSAEMERMWQERADYGHFFYRIPNGESAADAYDRVSGFNESMWRLFGEEEFPSVSVLVTHGLMTRVFLMKWYHWSVEYFEDLRNINHCEFIIMKQNPANGKYLLENKLRTWSDLKKRAAAANALTTQPAPFNGGPPHPSAASSPTIPARRWGGCADGCDHGKVHYPRRTKRQNTLDFNSLPAPAIPESERPDNSVGGPPLPLPPDTSEDQAQSASKAVQTETPTSNDGDAESSSGDETPGTGLLRPVHALKLHPGRDFGGSNSGAGTPAEGYSDDSDYFAASKLKEKRPTCPMAEAARKKEENSWKQESGMGSGARADALGDGSSGEDNDEADAEALIEQVDGVTLEDSDPGAAGRDDQIEGLKDKSRKSFSEVY
ncbi:phosphoglycerate mutase-like protein [Saccharata proteae CBS 121410]|uniref:Phosphoglycerate mutase-like protein n=1 Tax=Saccharata proteae CBS 121410 TaxID=1314787 RepID=A0A6A5YBZ4_9PEZI|nr:phosphoglycerate mutase-like protein [Saccharata proteae CBS 121410]